MIAPPPPIASPAPAALAAPPQTISTVEAPSTDAAIAPFVVENEKGTPLHLAKLEAHTLLDSPVAVTEVRLTVENTTGQSAFLRFLGRTGRPAQVVSARMEVDGVVRQGGVSGGARSAESKAKISENDFLGQVTDSPLYRPSLVVPLPPLGTGAKAVVVVTYAELLDSGAYRLPLRGLPGLDVVSAHVRVRGEETPVADLDLAGSAPEGDLVVPADRYETDKAHAVQAGELVAVQFDQLGGEASPLSAPIFLVDTSVARVTDLGRAVEIVAGITKKLAGDTPIKILAFDNEVTSVFEGQASQLTEADLGKLRSRLPLGLPHTARAIRFVAKDLGKAAIDRRLIYLGSAFSAPEDLGPDSVASAASSLRDAGIVRADAIYLGELPPHRNPLIDLVHAGKTGGRTIDGTMPLEAITSALTVAETPVAIATTSGTILSPTGFGDANAVPSRSFLIKLESAAQPLYVTRNKREVRVAIESPAAKNPSNAQDQANIERALAALASSEPNLDVAGASSGPGLAQARTAILRNQYTLIESAKEPDPSHDLDPLDDSVSSHATPVEPVAVETPPPAPVVDAQEAVAAEAVVVGHVPAETVRRIVRLNFGRFRACYIDSVRKHPKVAGRITTKVVVDSDGSVHSAEAFPNGSEVKDADLIKCVEESFSKINFPSSDSGIVFTYPIVFSKPSADGTENEVAAQGHLEVGHSAPKPPTAHTDERPFEEPLKGRLLKERGLLEGGKVDEAIKDAVDWTHSSPTDPLGYIALGTAASAGHNLALAERAFSSVGMLYPDRPDLLRFAGENLDAVGTNDALDLSSELYRRAMILEPHEPTSYRLYAFAELRHGRPDVAFRTLERALMDQYDQEEFVTAKTALSTDLRMVAGYWRKKQPERKKEIEDRLRTLFSDNSSDSGVRWVATWETKTRRPTLIVSNPSLVRVTGRATNPKFRAAFGPDEVTSPGKPSDFPARMGLDFGKVDGAFGYSMGKVEIIRFDRMGDLEFEERPFVVMNGVAKFDLGMVDKAAP